MLVHFNSTETLWYVREFQLTKHLQKTLRLIKYSETNGERERDEVKIEEQHVFIWKKVRDFPYPISSSLQHINNAYNKPI